MQDSARNNIFVMSEFEHAKRSLGPQESSILNDCRDIACVHLLRSLHGCLEKAVDEFFAAADKALYNDVQNLYMEALGLARDKHEIIETGFKKAWMQSFNRVIRSDKSTSASRGQSGELALRLSLVEPDDLEEALASRDISNKLREDTGEELFAIERRMGYLLHDHELEHTDNPLSPEAIGEAFMDALKGLDTSVKVRLILVMHFNKHMPSEVKAMYQNINQHLVSKGVLPKIRAGLKKRAAAPANFTEQPVASQDMDAYQAPAANPQSAPNGGDIFTLLQRLLTSSGQGVRMPVAGSAPAPASANGVADPNGLSAILQGTTPGEALPGAAPVIFDALNQIQHGDMGAFVAGNPQVDASGFISGRVNMLREIRTTTVGNTMGQMDAMTLDIVAMMFDFILEDKNVPDAMKAMIGRLQIPVLKVAMLDKSFFSQRSHPARRLLDTLAEAAIGFDEGEDHETVFFKTVETFVQRILDEFEDEVSIFAEVLEELRQYLDGEARKAAGQASLSASVIQRREQVEIARIMAHDEVRRRLDNPLLPEVIGSFMAEKWMAYLIEAHINSGEDGTLWNQALETMDDLIWSVTPKVKPEERKRLVSMLPGLLKRLQDGMAAVAISTDDRDQFFARLVECHSTAVKAGLQPLREVTNEEQSQGDYVVEEKHPIVLDEIPVLTEESNDFQAVEIPVEATVPDEAIANELLDNSFGHNEDWDLEEITVEDVRWESALDEEGDDYDAIVHRLKRGTWVEIEQDDGSMTRAKLAWVSPLKGVYLFTNRLGARAASISPTALADKFRRGKAQIIDEVPLVDRAVNNLMERLKSTAVAA